MRLLFLIIIIGVVIFFIVNNSQSNQYICERCEGKGFWKGLRGEKNHCKACNGTGNIEQETT